MFYKVSYVVTSLHLKSRKCPTKLSREYVYDRHPTHSDDANSSTAWNHFSRTDIARAEVQDGVV